MDLTLYRVYADTPLGCFPNHNNRGIRSEKDYDAFEFIAKFYGHNVSYSTCLDKCDMVLFNLDRNDIYKRLNPILTLPTDIIEKIKSTSIPVIFWHSGECHNFSGEDWYEFACRHINRKIWLVDGNARTTDPVHKFFDSSEVLLSIIDKSQQEVVIEKRFDFGTFSQRTDLHKHIVVNHLKNNHAQRSICHYTNPTDLDLFDDWKPEFDCSTPQSSEYVSWQEIKLLKKQCRIIITLDTQFLNDHRPEYDFFDPLYITEKYYHDFRMTEIIIPVGHHGLVRYLKKEGFHFPSWIDYSYDNILDHRVRLMMILDQVDRISRLPDLSMRVEDFSRGQHNCQLSLKRRLKTQFDNLVKILVDKI